ncbi:hypothetical protein MU582_19315 [Nocardioidaceae bacterium SCSIO 66511]|nr:hypothetical protein MU582_19315 [Nocardioidaceae bacterium SCSIO 66511]
MDEMAAASLCPLRVGASVEFVLGVVGVDLATVPGVGVDASHPVLAEAPVTMTSTRVVTDFDTLYTEFVAGAAVGYHRGRFSGTKEMQFFEASDDLDEFTSLDGTRVIDPIPTRGVITRLRRSRRRRTPPRGNYRDVTDTGAPGTYTDVDWIIDLDVADSPADSRPDS